MYGLFLLLTMPSRSLLEMDTFKENSKLSQLHFFSNNSTQEVLNAQLEYIAEARGGML
jgi:hypothetical protein